MYQIHPLLYFIFPVFSATLRTLLLPKTVCLSLGIVFLLMDTSHSLLLQLSYCWCPYGTGGKKMERQDISAETHGGSKPPKDFKERVGKADPLHPSLPFSTLSLPPLVHKCQQGHSTASPCSLQQPQELQAQHLLTTHMLWDCTYVYLQENLFIFCFARACHQDFWIQLAETNTLTC